MGVGTASSKFAFVPPMPPDRAQAPNPTCFCKRNVENPYCSLRGQPAAKPAYGGAGVACWNKRMLRCNGADTGLNVTRHESEPTSDRWCVARNIVEPLAWGHANGHPNTD